jgi:hypothetical protein
VFCGRRVNDSVSMHAFSPGACQLCERRIQSLLHCVVAFAVSNRKWLRCAVPKDV